MKILPVKEAKTHFSQLLELAKQEPIKIEKKGHTVAVMLSFEEYERLSALESQLLSSHKSQVKIADNLTVEDRLSILKLPLKERQQLLKNQAEMMVSHYQENLEWQEFTGGDLIEY